MQARSERLELRLEPEILDQVDNWRTDQSDAPSRSEAVRRLIYAGLNDRSGQQGFELTRLQILTAALTPGPREKISPSYAYAWDARLYPVFAGTAELHAPFEEFFTTGKAQLNELYERLDERWLKGDVPSFYELENDYGVRYRADTWSRGRLISACRYAFLDGRFNEEFWNKLLEPGDHPAEARGIDEPYDVRRDISFI